MRPSRTNASRLNKSWLRFRIPGDPQPCPSTRRINTGSANQNYCAALSLTCFFQGFNKYHTNRLPTPHAGASPVGVLMDRRHVENPDFQSQKKAVGWGCAWLPGEESRGVTELVQGSGGARRDWHPLLQTPQNGSMRAGITEADWQRGRLSDSLGHGDAARSFAGTFGFAESFGSGRCAQPGGVASHQRVDGKSPLVGEGDRGLEPAWRAGFRAGSGRWRLACSSAATSARRCWAVGCGRPCSKTCPMASGCRLASGGFVPNVPTTGGRVGGCQPVPASL